MYEFTMGGLWFRWSALDAPAKRLAAGSFITALIAAIPAGLAFGEQGYAFGYSIGHWLAGGDGERLVVPNGALLTAEPWMAWVTLGFGIVSALLWWRFSLRQDEMFNRIQNHALGRAGGWSMAVLCVWIAAAAGGMLPYPAALGIVGTFVVLLCAFWSAAVRRWA